MLVRLQLRLGDGAFTALAIRLRLLLVALLLALFLASLSLGRRELLRFLAVALALQCGQLLLQSFEFGLLCLLLFGKFSLQMTSILLPIAGVQVIIGRAHPRFRS